MPVIVLPYIPSTITVHLGLPDQWAENVTVSFPDLSLIHISEPTRH